MTVAGRVDPRCARGLRVTYDLRACAACASEGAARAWGATVGADGTAVRIVSPFRFELRIHAEQVELWHRLSRPAPGREADRAEVEALLAAAAAGGCAHG